MAYAMRTEGLKQVFADLASALAESDNLKALTGRALDTPLGDLASFMKYAEQTKALRKVFADLASALAESDNLKALTGRALDGPLGHLTSFHEVC